MCREQNTCVTVEEEGQCSAWEFPPGSTQTQGTISGFHGEGRQLLNTGPLDGDVPRDLHWLMTEPSGVVWVTFLEKWHLTGWSGRWISQNQRVVSKGCPEPETQTLELLPRSVETPVRCGQEKYWIGKCRNCGHKQELQVAHNALVQLSWCKNIT